MEKITAILTTIAIFVISSLVTAFFAMLLWNYTVPTTFHGPTLTFSQAFGLYLLLQFITSAVTGTFKKE